METQRKRIRRDYAPLTIHAGLVCTTPGSPLTQVYNSRRREYEPDRGISPTVVHPDVACGSPDGSWRTSQSNPRLAEMVWKVGGRDISTLPEWRGFYSVDTSTGATRGDITISKNLTPGTRLELSFEAVIADVRLGVNIPVRCDAVVLGTSDSSVDDYSMSIGDDQIIRYDPFKDRLHLYEYKVAHGLASASSAARSAATDSNSYERTIPVTVYKGSSVLPASSYDLRLFQVTGITSAGAQLRELGVEGEVVGIANDGVTIDLRVIEKRDYLLRAYSGGSVLAEKQFSVGRVCPKFTVRPTNGTSISPHDTERRDVAMVDCGGSVVECPERIVSIVWKTDSQSRQGVVHGEGGSIVFPLSDTGIGDTWADDWLDIYCEGTQKGVMSVATDENGDTLTDENGDTYIFN